MWPKFSHIERYFDDARSFDAAAKVVPFFYYVLLFIAFQRLEGLNPALAQNPAIFEPRWPIFWANYFSYQTSATYIIVGLVVSSLIGAFWHRQRFARIVAFAGLFSYHAFLSSFGGPQHQFDLWLWIAGILVLLPDAWGEAERQLPETRRKFLMIFWGAQAFMLLTYSMSGLGKVLGAMTQYLQGQAHAFSPDAAALHIASFLYTMQETTPLGPFVVAHPWLGWFPFVIFVCLELFSFFVAFRPSLQRPWGLALIVFHFGTFLTMRAVFIMPVPLLAIFFLSSPFQEKIRGWREVVGDLPLLGLALRRVRLTR